MDRAGVCSASTKGLDVGLSRPSKVLVGDRRERQQLDLVDLDHHGTARVDASDLDLWSRPEAVGEGDGSVGYSIAKIRAELHAAILAPDDRLRILVPGCRTPGGVAWLYLFVGLRRFRRAGRVLMRSMTLSVHAMPTSS